MSEAPVVDTEPATEQDETAASAPEAPEQAAE
jgi:hypothetical protein